MQDFLRQLWTDESGQDATEYVLLVVLIALVVTAGMSILATGINDAFQDAADTLGGEGGAEE